METIQNNQETKLIRTNLIEPSAINPRTYFCPVKLEELSGSVKEVGVIQAIVIRPKGNKFEIVCGERRFRATLLAGLEEIPAVIRELTDEEALDLALTENIQREDVEPMDEALCFKNYIEKRNMDIPALCLRFGKSETYVRGRIRLNELIPEFIQQMTEGIITLSSAFELCKYSTEIQKDIFEQYYKEEDHWNSWRKVSAKDLSSKIEKKYTTKLDLFHFDKTDCNTCPHNSNNFLLFADSSGACGNCALKSCLLAKNTDYMVQSILKALNDDPSIQLGQRYSYNEKVYETLTGQGYEITEIDTLNREPDMPEPPAREKGISKADHAQAQAEHKAKVEECEKKKAEYKSKVEQGLLAKFILIGDSDWYLCYVPVSNVTNGPVNITHQIEKLEIRDKRNKEIAREKIVADTKSLVHKVDVKSGDFSDLEEQLVYFFLLSSLKSSRYKEFKVKSNYLEAEQKLKIVKSLTDEKKKMIRRDYLIDHLSKSYGLSDDLLLQFTRQHLPEDLSKIEAEHNAIYKKRHQRFKERVALMKMQEKAQILQEEPAVAKQD